MGSLCLAPLVIVGVGTQVHPPNPTAFGAPCLTTTCDDGLALGGGFLLEGVSVHGSHRGEDMETWVVCGGEEPKASPTDWQSFAQCALGSGDIVVNTEVHAIDGSEGLTCFDAACPPGTTLVGGGGRWGPSFGFQGSEPTDDGAQWEVCGSGTGAMAVIEVDAHCAVLPEGAETHVVEDVQSVAGGDVGCAHASCSKGFPIAGGVNTAITMTAIGSYPEPNQWTSCGRADANFNVQVQSRVLCLEG